MTGVIYARYSSDNQREESIEGQLRECTAFAEKNDIKILGTYIDRALSAKTDNRPDFQRMIKDSARNMFDVIIVWKLDRFARNRYDSAHYKNILKKNNVKVMSATEAISQGAEGIILESVLEGMAEYYSAELAEKVIRGMTENAMKCRFNGGTIPQGYFVDSDHHLQIDPETAPFVVEAYNLYLAGKTIKEVAQEMNKKGFRNTWGTEFSVNTMTNLLKNRRYIGEYKYRDIVIPDGIPQIVPTDIFDAVQKKIEVNKRAPARHKAEEDYLLTTKFFCGDCGSLMVGEIGTSRNGSKHRYYKCISAKRKRGCRKKAVKKDVIEDAVIGQIQKIIMDDETVEAISDTVMELQNQENTTLPLLTKQLYDTERRVKNMLSAIEEGVFTPSTKQRLTELEEKKTELELSIAREKVEKPMLAKDQITFWFKRMRELNFESLEHRKLLVETFVNSVVLYDKRIELVLNYKDGARSLTFEEMGVGSDMSKRAPPKIDRLRQKFVDFLLLLLHYSLSTFTLGRFLGSNK